MMTHNNSLGIALSIWILLFPSFGVTADDVWTEVKSPNFVVISNASPKLARKTARSLEQFQSLIKSALPALSVDPGTPLTVFAAKDERTFNTLLAEDKLPKGASRKAGLFTGGPERKLVALRLDLPVDQAYHVIYHEYVHMLMRLNLGDIPLWLSEGLAEFFSYATLSDGQSILGQPGPQSLEVLRTQPMIPLETLLLVKHDSPYYRDQDKATIFYAQSWALTHYLMIGDKRVHAKQLDEYLSLLKSDASDQKSAANALGDFTILEKSLRNYVGSAAFYSYSISAKLPVEAEQYAARTLSPVESLGARGELLVYADKLDQAKAMLDQCLQMDPRSGRANEAMGHLYFRKGDRGQAEKYFSIAAEMDTDSYLAQFYSAQSKVQRGSDEDMRLAETQLRRAVTLNPVFAPAYSQLSYVLQKHSRFQEALDMAEKAALLEPGEIRHRFNVAYLMLGVGRIDDAVVRVQQILAKAQTDAERSQAEDLMSQVQRLRNSRASIRSAGAEPQRPPLNSHSSQVDDKKVDAQLRTLDEMGKKRKAQAELRANLKTGPPATLSGHIKSVKCDYPATMDLVLETQGKQHKLHAENYYQVQYGTIGGAGGDSFDPCGELEGKNAEIDILNVSGADFSGIIKVVAIKK